MIIQNSTQNEIFYAISSPGQGDCGNINANKEQEVGYDNTSDVSVNINPVGTSVFSIVIPQTGTENSVTIGMYFN